MRPYLIANPHARNGLGGKKLLALRRSLEARGQVYDLAICESLEHATQLSRAANLSSRELIVAVGGDGTINRVLNGFFDPEGKRLSPARFGVVHIGTSPDFCRSYGIPTSVEAAVDTLLGGEIQPVGVGRVSWTGDRSSGCSQTAFFGCCANLGLGAAVARGANTGIRRLAGDSLGTLLCLLHALARFRPRRVLLSLDGRQTRLEGVLNVAVGKTHYIASGLRVRHALEAQDRRLYVLCARDVSLRTLLPALRALYSGQPIRPGNGLSLAYAEQICVEPTDAPVEVEFDGDPAGNCPCRIETAIDSLDLLVSNALRGQPL